ncbi:helix-turn-helix domain-containing protein, partial [Salmonella enterica subsp. enterica serovar Newport]|nr:helix-turn-helix domain-containing protein [Salmonella enterica subsp. enterica serovar Newport]
MILYTKKPCSIVLAEKATQVKVNDLEPIIIPENHLVLLSGRDKIYFPSLIPNLVVHISHDVILDYLNSIKCDLAGFTHRVKRNSLPPLFTCFNRTPEIFRSAALYSQSEIVEFCDSQRTRFLIFSVLSNFLIHSEFMFYLIDINRMRVSDSVYHLIMSNLNVNWNLNMVARSLCLSNSLLKKRLKDENTSYSKILTNCRMHHATKLLQTTSMNINQVSELCGYHNSSYFI